MMYGKMQVEYDDTTKLSEEKKWKKIVYGGMQERYEDNYTDESFLEDMVMNANVVRRDTLTAIREAMSVAQYVCTVAIVGSVWAYSLRSDLDHRGLLSVDCFLFAMGFMVLLLRIPWSDLVRYILKVGFFASTLYVLAPVYQTLTRSISSDTIWALTVFLLLVHLFLHDYVGSTIKSPFSVIETGKKTNPSQDQSICNVINNISLNASIVASVLIASRLPSRVLVFAVLLFSLELFLFSPLITHCIKQYSSKVYLLFSFVLMGVAFALVYPLHRVLFFMLVCLVFFIVIVCPYWVVRAQEYKFEINGPWDEAKLCFDITE